MPQSAKALPCLFTSPSYETSLRILPATREDIPELADVQWEAFSSDLSHQLHSPSREESMERLRKAMNYWIGLKEVSIYKAVEVAVGDQEDGDTHKEIERRGGGENGKIVGSAVWVALDGSQPLHTSFSSGLAAESIKTPPLTSFLPVGGVLPPRSALFTSSISTAQPPRTNLGETIRGALISVQLKWIAHKAVIYLAGLSVLPSSQGQGVGSALLRVGMDRADDAGMSSWLEATPNGYPVYLHRGWNVVETMEFDLSQWAGEDKGYGAYRFRAMLRLPVPKLLEKKQ